MNQHDESTKVKYQGVEQFCACNSFFIQGLVYWSTSRTVDDMVFGGGRGRLHNEKRNLLKRIWID